MDATRQQLFRRIEAMIRGDESETFENLALEVFRYQYAANEPYRGYCAEKGISADTVTSWTAIPAFPSEAFKKQIVTSFPYEKAVMANITGGTGDPSLRGIIFRDKMGKDLVLGANRAVMSRYVFPEGERMPVLVLGPSPKTAPSMGMAIGMSETIREFGTDESGFFITRRGFLVKELVRTIRKVAEKGKPLAIIGATSAFVFLFNACRQHGLRLPLPKGSRIVDGGGYRGRFGECGRDDYYTLCADVFGVPESHCINVLGMAENATNYVDNMLRSAFERKAADRIKHDLPWTRVVAMDLETCSRVLPEGEVGLLRHFDLANLPTVLAVQTENLGVRTADGFEIIGRAQVVDGKVVELPSEDPVGPMGDKKIFRYLDAYLKFSVNRQIKRISKEEYQCTCGEIIEDMMEK